MGCGCGAGRTRLLGSQPLPVIIALRQGSGESLEALEAAGRIRAGRLKGQESKPSRASQFPVTRIELFADTVTCHSACRCTRA
jgi:hypothetical protein